MRARRPAVLTVVALTLASCALEESAPERWSDAWILAEGERYLEDTEYRRQALLDSLESHENVYARERIGNYGLGESGWDALPAWNPRVRPMTAEVASAIEAGDPVVVGDEVAPLWDGRTPETMEAWVELGRRVFFTYPLRADPYIEHGIREPELGRAVGFERTADGEYPGVVALRQVDGRSQIGIACAVCHTSVRDGELVIGAARRRFDYGALRLAYHEATGVPVDPDLARRMATWGPGRADITADETEDPVAIPDLWGLRAQSSLTQAGTIRHVSPTGLAIRQETQLLHANLQRARPPRALAWALAMFLYSLTPPAAETTEPAEAVARGEQVFAANCASCHQNEVFGGPVVPATLVGTDPSLAFGEARGTGLYRPPTLLRVRDAAPYFHDGSVPSLEALFSPERFEASYAGSPLGPGAVEGHRFGVDLPPADREALLSFLRSL